MSPAGTVAIAIDAIPNPEEVQLVDWLAEGPVRASTSWSERAGHTPGATPIRTAPGTVLGRFADAGMARRIQGYGREFAATPKCRQVAEQMAAIRKRRRDETWTDTDAAASASRATAG